MLLDCKEAGYGGATGGGKSDALLMDALQFVHIPGYAALLFRRTYSDLSLPGALMDRAHEWLKGTNAKWKEKEKTWVFPHDGGPDSSLTFGFMDTEKDRYRYASTELQYVGFDEGTQFAEIMYTFMSSRLRYNTALMDAAQRIGYKVPLRLRLATNPGGIGHEWVKRRFIIEGPANGRVFVPSKLIDNPSVDYDSYMEMLGLLDPVTREQYINGNWDAIETGGQFERTWFNGKIKKLYPKFKKIVRYWDLAATKPNPGNPDPDWTCGALCALDENNEYWILDIVRIRETSGVVRQLVQSVAEDDIDRYGDVQVWAEQEPGSSGSAVASAYKKEYMSEFAMRFEKTSGKKEFRARVVAIAAQHGIVNVFDSAFVPAMLDEFVSFGLEGVHDDQVDAVSGAFRKLRRLNHEMYFGALADAKTINPLKQFEAMKAQAGVRVVKSPMMNYSEYLDGETRPGIRMFDVDGELLYEENVPLDPNDAYQASIARGKAAGIVVGR